MRTVDERVSAVQSRARRLRRRRNDHVLAALAVFMALPLVGLVGRYATGGLPAPSAQGDGLFGAASLLGSSVGGYVIVAVVSFAIAVFITVFLMLRRHSGGKEGSASEAAISAPASAVDVPQATTASSTDQADSRER